MKISLNELQSVCRKAFMGMGFTAGHADDASAMVAWMQSYKLDGMKELSEGLECVVASAASARPDVIYQDADLAVVDGQHMSVLSSGNLALELAFAKARIRGLAVIKIRHCRQRQLIMGYLARLASRGMNVTAFWRHSQSPITEQVVGFRAGSAVPSIRVYELADIPEDDVPNDGVTILMANHVDLLPTIRSEDEYKLLARHDESDLLAAKQQALEEGLTVDPEIWQQLKSFAAKTLVEASEQSRSGAGPAE
jgi:LDH2 family malate/lactate/ureidoglycolate dehydrogenase